MKNRITPKTLIICITFCFASILCSGQNVGIGNPLPDARLNVNTGRNIPALTITDSTSSKGGTMLFKNDKDTLAFEVSTYTSNNPGNNFMDIKRQDQPANEAIITMRGNGNVGINKIVPTSRLDVNGNMNLSGNIKVDNVQGEPGQALITKSDGSTGWGSLEPTERFRNNRFITVSQNFVVPPGVTEIGVELWGAGGAGSFFDGGGSSGNYRYVIFTVTPGQSFSFELGKGGAWDGITADGDRDGGYTQIISGGLIYARANGGFRAQQNNPPNSVNNITTVFTSYTKVIQGSLGERCVRNFGNTGTTFGFFHETKLGDGGKPIKFSGETSKGGQYINFVDAGFSHYSSTASNYSAGGAAYYSSVTLSIEGVDGGDGVAYVYW